MDNTITIEELLKKLEEGVISGEEKVILVKRCIICGTEHTNKVDWCRDCLRKKVKDIHPHK